MTRCTLCLIAIDYDEFHNHDHLCEQCARAVSEDFRDWTIKPYPGLQERLARFDDK